MARRVKGAGRVKAIIRGLPDSFRQEMADVLEQGGQSLVPAMKERAPRRTGATQNAIGYKVNRKSLRLRVGLLSSKAGRSNLFHSRIQDLGRKAQTVRARRHGGQPYLIRVRAMAGKHFVTGRFTDLRTLINRNLRGIFSRALAKLSSGSD